MIRVFWSVVPLLAVCVTAILDRAPMFKWNEGIDAAKVLYAVNCGSDVGFQDFDGVTYRPDEGYSGG